MGKVDFIVKGVIVVGRGISEKALPIVVKIAKDNGPKLISVAKTGGLIAIEYVRRPENLEKAKAAVQMAKTTIAPKFKYSEDSVDNLRVKKKITCETHFYLQDKLDCGNQIFKKNPQFYNKVFQKIIKENSNGSETDLRVREVFEGKLLKHMNIRM